MIALTGLGACWYGADGEALMARGKLVLTYQDYLQMPDDLNRREILGGDLYVTPAPTPLHQQVLGNLLVRLHDWVRTHSLGKVYVSPIDVVLSEIDVVQPDLIFVSRERLDIVTEKSIQGAPDLAIEILSPSTASLDRRRKLDTYARFGITEYWLIDPESRTAEIYRLRAETYDLFLRAGEDESVSSSILSGLTVSLADFWA